MKTIRSMTLAALLAAGLAIGSANAIAQQGSDGAAVKGKITAVDQSSQTLTIKGRTYKVLPTTRITHNDQQKSLSDLKEGQQVTARYKQSAENERELLTVELGETVAGSSRGGATSRDVTSETGTRFSGKVSKVDEDEQTFSIGGRTYHVLPTSRIMSNDKQLSFEDIQPGTQLTGQFKKSDENKLEVLSVEVPSAVGGTSDESSSQTGSSFSGKVTKVDTANQTLTVGSRTYRILPTTMVTSASGQATTLSDVKKNQQVSGTYKKSDDGQYELLSLQVGKSKD